jgi:hypothetical protein
LDGFKTAPSGLPLEGEQVELRDNKGRLVALTRVPRGILLFIGERVTPDRLRASPPLADRPSRELGLSNRGEARTFFRESNMILYPSEIYTEPKVNSLWFELSVEFELPE